MYTTCVGCGCGILSAGLRGPRKQKCDRCKAADQKKRRLANPKKHSLRHKHKCQHCGVEFHSARKLQKHCSPKCRQLASRSRLTIQCANQLCGKWFEVTPSQYAKGSRCCSDKCKYEHRRLPSRLCQNPECGETISRERRGHKHTSLGKDYEKYCCTECYHDHRWGKNRPRKSWPKPHLRSSSRQALQTSLRRKCKLLGVPYDAQCVRHVVCERDNWVCQECGIVCLQQWTFDKQTRKIDQRSAEHDHIIPLTCDGSPGNVFPNSQCLCHACNHSKRDKARGQLRLDLEGSVKRWEKEAHARSLRHSKSCEAIQGAAQSTTQSHNRHPMAL